MTSSFAKLNLRPQERRLVVVVFIALFAVVNFVWVWPHFGDWTRTKLQLERTQKTLQTYRGENLKAGAYRIKLRELESAGPSVLPEEQGLDLVRIVNEQSIRNRLNVTRADPRPKVSSSTTQTNRFFEEQYVTIHVNTGNEELVNFLVSLASTNSLIRVKDLNIKPEPSGFKLDGDITLVASYQKSAPRKPQIASSSPSPALASAAKTPAARSSSSGSSSKPAATSSGSAPKVTNKVTTSRVRLTNQPAKK